MLCCPDASGCYKEGFRCCGNGLACLETTQCCGLECCGDGFECFDGGCYEINITTSTTAETTPTSLSTLTTTNATTTAKSSPSPTVYPSSTDFTENPGKYRTPIAETMIATAVTEINVTWAYVVFPLVAIGVILILLAVCFVISSRTGSYSPNGFSSKVSAYVIKMKTLVYGPAKE
ncbi:uncharacterized protein LOC127848544 [Dreissena polymorpha]|nr:uncharacterized protein LOC127848544 [Dreissena polymorpha]